MKSKSRSDGFLLAFLGGFLCGSCSLSCFVVWSVYRCCPPRRHTNQTHQRILAFANAVVAANEIHISGNGIKTSPQLIKEHSISVSTEVPPPTYEETVMQDDRYNIAKVVPK